MTFDDVPVFSLLKSRLDYLADRQRLIAENVANADTPGYAPRDLKPFKVPGGQGGGASSGSLAMAETSGMHISGGGGTTPGSPSEPVASPDSESTLNGNSVVLEEEMMKMSESRIDYEAAVGFYQQSLNLLQMAAKRPGQ